jgi:hypothetical protein
MMTPIKPKETDYLTAWALFVLCATVAGFIVGFVVGGVLGALLKFVGAPPTMIAVLCSGAGFVASLPISYLFFRIFVSRFIVQKLVTQMVADGTAPG